jgi:2-phosphosulfolactate phosphatase
VTRRIDVAFCPGQAATGRVVCVVDTIRASTVIAQALAAGYEHVVCTGQIGDAVREAATYGSGVVLGGERHGVRIDGFTLGNSPSEYVTRRGSVLVFTTTNGTRAILQAVDEADHVLVASLTCLSSVTESALRLAGDGDITLRCAGVDGGVALDDAYVAGRIVQRLLQLDPGRDATDAALVAAAVASAFADAETALAASQSARNLADVGLAGDVAACARESTVAVAPRVVSHAAGRAVVGI